MENRENKNWANFYLGLAVAILPFLNLPGSGKTAIFVIAGFLIALFSLARTAELSQKNDQIDRSR